MSRIYRLGTAYMRRRYEVDGAEGLWQTLVNPPASTATIRTAITPDSA